MRDRYTLTGCLPTHTLTRAGVPATEVHAPDWEWNPGPLGLRADILTTGQGNSVIFFILNNKMCKHVDLHNSFNQYFPNASSWCYKIVNG